MNVYIMAAAEWSVNTAKTVKRDMDRYNGNYEAETSKKGTRHPF